MTADKWSPLAVDCTIGILTFNSAATLERTLKATRDFKERIICDGGSTDGTLELARSHGCRVLMQSQAVKRVDNTLRDFGGAMQQLLSESTMPWFFKVDSDEVPSVGLVDELRTALRVYGDADGFMVPLKYVFRGHVIADASTYPMCQLRIIRVGSGLGFSGQVHEHIEYGDHVIRALHQPQLLPQVPVRTLIPRWWRYLKIEADAARTVPLGARWHDHAQRHLRLAKFLAWRYTKVLRSGSKPRLPLRFEILRVVNHLVAAAVIVGAPRHEDSHERHVL